MADTERCKDCDECAKLAYSDATTPGFFYVKCAKHRAHDVTVRVDGTALQATNKSKRGWMGARSESDLGD